MKRVVSLLLSAALLLGLLSACRKTSPDVPPAQARTARELAEAALLASGYGGSDGELEYLTTTVDDTEEVQGEDGRTVYFNQEVLTVYLENAYNIHSAELPWEDAAVIRATGASAFEIAVLRMEDSSSAVRAASALTTYMSDRQGDFAGYAPVEADMAAHGSIMQNGPFAALFICPDPDGAYKAVDGALSGEYDPDNPRQTGPVEDVKALRDLLVSGQKMDGEELERLDDGDQDALSAYVRDIYGLTPDQWEECAVARGRGDLAFEIAVLRVPNDWEVIGNVQQALNRYLDRREAEFDSASEQARLFHGAIAGESNPYVVLLACQDRTGAIDQFSAAADTMGFGYSLRHRYLDTDHSYPDRCLFTQPNKDDMSLYDTADLRAAWERGDPSELAQYDRDIFDQAEKVLNKVIKDGMSDYEKEAAVYEWMVNNVNYDWTHQNMMRETPRESFTPYGGLVNRTAVCLGYATTFQLLMDLAGVECITVVGAAHGSQEDHGWNMVRLNGEWYCVDVTWDANYREQGGRSGREQWSYFNVTSDYMADTDHQWDYANIPEATVEGQGQS